MHTTSALGAAPASRRSASSEVGQSAWTNTSTAGRSAESGSGSPSTRSSTSSVMVEAYESLRRGGLERGSRLPGGGGDDEAAGGREHGDDRDRGARGGRVGAEAGDQRSEDEAEVPPEAVHAD